MKFCPFIGVSCKLDECQFFQKQDSACSLVSLVQEIREMKDVLSSPKGEEERTLLQEVSSKLETMAVASISAESLQKSIGETLKELVGSVQNTEADLTKLREDGIEKFSSGVSAALERVDQSLQQVEKSHKKISRFLTELKRSAKEEAERRRLEDAQTHNDRGVTLFYTGTKEAARVEFERAIELDPDMAEAYSNLAVTLTEMEMNDEAIESLKKAYTIKPDLPEAYSNLALIHFRRGNIDQAIQLLEEATSQPRSTPVAQMNLGEGFLQLGRFEDALRAWERALEIDPSNETAKERIALYKEGKLSGHHTED